MVKQGLISFICIMLCAGYALGSDGIAAIVGDSIILRSEVEEMVALEMESMGAQRDLMMENITYEQVLEEMVENMVIAVHAERDSLIAVPHDRVSAAVEERIQALLRENNMTRTDLERELIDGYGISFDEYEERLFTQMQSQMIMQNIQQVYLKTSLTRGEVREIFEEYRDSIPGVGESYRFQEIKISVQADSSLRQDLYSKLINLREDIIAGTLTFPEAAKKYSEGPNAARGGRLGFISKGDLALRNLERQIFWYSPGDISPPIETSMGFHLVRITGRRGSSLEVEQIFLPLPQNTQAIADAQFLLDSIASHSTAPEEFAQAARKFSEDPISKSYDGYTSWMSARELRGTLREKVRSESYSPGDMIGPFQERDALYLYRFHEYEADRKLSFEHDYHRIKEIAESIASQRKISDLARTWRRDILVTVY
ncbi:peptidylprolyl isomerase [Chitinivibrio alkaliphilus]|uniref:PpiC-type peptidyl-prolyl cis-trans isomerase n=1 Tax=Chitinivibrio alkaliphilus ACht1 TaxID=1313304 RepID=U7DBI3_9BACT|nr:peptidylprolyl isomerase [Chitinivibrio alkaliphilus]ERP38923.1 PpiC-type peptidyl-prolyl cis-trans isomerase [Chitinivibrio alkaliphilus ACht1]